MRVSSVPHLGLDDEAVVEIPVAVWSIFIPGKMLVNTFQHEYKDLFLLDLSIYFFTSMPWRVSQVIQVPSLSASEPPPQTST